MVVFCGRTCQEASWKQHKKECFPRFSLAELEDPTNVAAKKARKNSPYGLYQEVYKDALHNEIVYDRPCPTMPFANTWTERRGDFYVSTDRAQLQIMEVQLGDDVKGGQYYSSQFGRDGGVPL